MPKESTAGGCVAAIASLVLPGLGHVLMGRTLAGLMAMLVTGSLWILALLFVPLLPFMPIWHLMVAFDSTKAV